MKIFSTRKTFGIILSAACLILAPWGVSPAVGQTSKPRLPRVGLIKDYPATGLMNGCGNLYFNRLPRSNDVPEERYVFLSRGDGTNAWIDLDGRDTRLKLFKTSSVKVKGKAVWHYFYRSGGAVIDVSIREKPKPADEDIPMLMTIVLRRAGRSRTVAAEGYSDC